MGAQGPTGMTGPAGADGVSVEVSPLDAGIAGCATGGARLVGSNGTVVVCNGVAGPSSVAACPAGMTKVDTAYSTLCFASGSANPSSWDQADAYCDNTYRASLCTHAQWRKAVCQAGLQNPGSSWLIDVAGAGLLATVAGCAGSNVGASSPTTQLRGPCCLEWPKY